MTPVIVRTVAELRAAVALRRKEGATVGFVPTMGYLHDGHASLLQRSAQENGATVLSIFVNPLQFGPNEDLDKYPRDEERDIAVAGRSGCDIVFLPSLKEMYPSATLTNVIVREVTEKLDGASRPGHFEGVATVVAKLFNIVQPDRAYFGMKDAQQVAVLTQMTRDLNVPVDIVPCPTRRAHDGLALSSRNVYLNAEEREQALVLSRSLAEVPDRVKEGMTAGRLIAWLTDRISGAPLADIDYVDVLAYPRLNAPDVDMPLKDAKETILAAVAVRFGKTRLIDNILLNPSEVR